jgi:hypothetical protein
MDNLQQAKSTSQSLKVLKKLIGNDPKFSDDLVERNLLSKRYHKYLPSDCAVRGKISLVEAFF